MRAPSSNFVLLRRASPVTRMGLVAVVVLALAARLGVVGTALAIDRMAPQVALVAGLVTTACYAAQRLAQALTRVRLERDLYRALVDSLLESDVLDVARERTQRVVFEGSYHAMQLAGAIVPALVTDIVASVAVVPVLALIFPLRLLAMAVVAMLVIAAGVLVARRLAHRGEQQLAAAYEEVGEALLVAVEGRLEIVARGGERTFTERFGALANRYVRKADRVGFASAWLGRAPLLVGGAVIAAVALVDESSRVEISTAIVTRAIVLAACLPPLLGAVVGVQAVARTRTLARPFIQLLAQRRRREPEGKRIVPHLPAAFELVDVSFRYTEDGPLAVSNVSFVWSADEPLTLVGANGSGKSTVLRLLMGLRPPTQGRIAVEGHDLATVDLRALRRKMAYLPQRPYLGELHATVRAAIHMTVPDASDRQIEEALCGVQLLDRMKAVASDPLDTQIGALSVGQRQRVALARLLLQDAPVVLLDEPDANLDREGIELVAALARKMCADGKMVAIAAHTPELAELASRVVRLASREHAGASTV